MAKVKALLTESGSVYQIDEARHRVRRVLGTTMPTPKFGVDGDWHEYASIEYERRDHRIFVTWHDHTSTLTSRIKQIEAMEDWTDDN